MTSKEWFPLETKAMGSVFKATFREQALGIWGWSGWVSMSLYPPLEQNQQQPLMSTGYPPK